MPADDHRPQWFAQFLADRGTRKPSAHPIGLTLTAYSPEPDSPSQDGLALLASWAATVDQSDQQETAHPGDRRDP